MSRAELICDRFYVGIPPKAAFNKENKLKLSKHMLTFTNESINTQGSLCFNVMHVLSFKGIKGETRVERRREA